jgi:hypothetical protein
MVTAYQAYALAHPLDRADLDLDQLAPLTRDAIMVDGNMLRAVLAVDR